MMLAQQGFTVEVYERRAEPSAAGRRLQHSYPMVLAHRCVMTEEEALHRPMYKRSRMCMTRTGTFTPNRWMLCPMSRTHPCRASAACALGGGAGTHVQEKQNTCMGGGGVQQGF